MRSAIPLLRIGGFAAVALAAAALFAGGEPQKVGRVTINQKLKTSYGQVLAPGTYDLYCENMEASVKQISRVLLYSKQGGVEKGRTDGKMWVPTDQISKFAQQGSEGQGTKGIGFPALDFRSAGFGPTKLGALRQQGPGKFAITINGNAGATIETSALITETGIPAEDAASKTGVKQTR